MNVKICSQSSKGFAVLNWREIENLNLNSSSKIWKLVNLFTEKFSGTSNRRVSSLKTVWSKFRISYYELHKTLFSTTTKQPKKRNGRKYPLKLAVAENKVGSSNFKFVKTGQTVNSIEREEYQSLVSRRFGCSKLCHSLGFFGRI